MAFISLLLVMPLVILLWGAGALLRLLFSYGSFLFSAMAVLCLLAVCAAAYLLRYLTVQGRFDESTYAALRAQSGGSAKVLFWQAARVALIMALVGCIAAALVLALLAALF